jgi:hypothetical protein
VRELLEKGLAYLKIGTPDFGQMVQRGLRIKGLVPDTTDPRYNLGITVEDFTRPEFWWLRRGIWGAAGGNQGAVAGQQSFITLALPQRKLVVIEQIQISTVIDTGFVVGFGPVAGGGGVVTANGADDRALNSTGNPGTALLIVQGTAAAPTVPAGANFYNAFAKVPIFVNTPIVMTGNSLNFNLILNTALAALTWSIRWRERELYPEEL